MGIFQASYALGMFVGPWMSGGVADSLGTEAVFILCGGLLVAAWGWWSRWRPGSPA